jgi:hypothetical protein
MFGRVYDWQKVAGFIMCPYDFKVNELSEYVKNNIAECRIKAQKHVERVKL